MSSRTATRISNYLPGRWFLTKRQAVKHQELENPKQEDYHIKPDLTVDHLFFNLSEMDILKQNGTTVQFHFRNHPPLKAALQNTFSKSSYVRLFLPHLSGYIHSGYYTIREITRTHAKLIRNKYQEPIPVEPTYK